MNIHNPIFKRTLHYFFHTGMFYNIFEIFHMKIKLCAGEKALLLLRIFLAWHNLSIGPKVYFQVFLTPYFFLEAWEGCALIVHQLKLFSKIY